MERLRFREQFLDYNRWKGNFGAVLERYQQWSDWSGLTSPETKRQLQGSLDLLRSDRLTVAFVAEFSRGKSELINAIFFAEFGRRLLPSSAGRTTMCPTELLYDQENERSYIRLLPIETRAEEATIAEYKRDPSQWTTIELNIGSPEQMQRALQEVVQVKAAPVEEARRLGLYSPESQLHNETENTLPGNFVEMPCWRHAIVSFPHPLLKQGLTILDTPGLNALGTEPELTLKMLPSAQAVVFVLGADTGVTRSDLDLWQHHIKAACGNSKNDLVVVLNKIDSLWDELKDTPSVEASILSQEQNTAAILGVDPGCIFPVSAQKGLLAKIKGDNGLLSRSGLLELESFLSSQMMTTRRQIILDRIGEDIEQLLENSWAVVSSRFGEAKQQLDGLKALTGEKKGLLQQMMKETRDEQTIYLKNIESFQAGRRIIGQQVRNMMDALSLDRVDQLIVNGRDEMLVSWTTVGLKSIMKALFERFHDAMREVQLQNEQTRRLVQAVYRKFQNEHGLSAVPPRVFRVMKYSVELEKLNQAAESFRKSPTATLTEQGLLIQKFFISIVSRARDIFYRANTEADAWTRELLNPLVREIKDHKKQMESRLETLKQVSQSKSSLEAKIKELEQQCVKVSRQLSSLQEIREGLLKEIAEYDAAQAAPAVQKQALS